MRPIEQLPPLGQHIRRYRRQNRWTISGLAKAIGMSKSYLFELENGTQINPTLRTMEMIASATNTNLSDIANLAAEWPSWLREMGDLDPTLWCNRCGAKLRAECECGPIPDNE